MGWTIVVALVLTALAFAHLLDAAPAGGSDARPPPTRRAASTCAARRRRHARSPGLFALILFSTFNNFIGGVYMALMDPYGLEMFSVEMWGTFFAIGATGFIVGGALIGKFGLGSNPLRTMLIAVVADGPRSGRCSRSGSGPGCTSSASGSTWRWCPSVEAAEQTVIQRVVPLPRQGRVFGFAMAFESAAAPITAFLIAPDRAVLDHPLRAIRRGRGPPGTRCWVRATSRGIALVFLAAGIIIVAVALLAFLTPVYRRVSASYARSADETPATAAP